MSINAGTGILEFPFSSAKGYWEWVELCEQGGVDSIWISDRVISKEPVLECMSAMAALAGATRRIKFGMNVASVGLRDPLLLAKQCATIDFLSNGRLLPAFGVGSPRAPEWQGEEIADRRLLVVAEQGLGDGFHFCRYLPMLVDRGADVTFVTRPQVTRLMSTLDPRVKAGVAVLTTPSPEVPSVSETAIVPAVDGTVVSIVSDPELVESAVVTDLPARSKTFARTLYVVLVVSAAAVMDPVPASENLVLSVSLLHLPHEDVSGLPAQIVMQAPRRTLLGFAVAKADKTALEAAVQVREY